jgi:hypothetical protein
MGREGVAGSAMGKVVALNRLSLTLETVLRATIDREILLPS